MNKYQWTTWLIKKLYNIQPTTANIVSKQYFLHSLLHRVDLLGFYESLALLLNASLTIDEAFTLLLAKQSHPQFKYALKQIQSHIRQGHALSSACAKTSDYFDPLFCRLVACGEEVGQLPTLLNRYAARKRILDCHRKKLLQKLTYPAILIVLSGLLFFIFIYSILPIFETLYRTLEVSPSKTCNLLFVVSHLLHLPWLIPGLMCGLVCVLIGGIYWLHLQKNKSSTLQRMTLMRHWALAYCLDTLSLLYEAGLPIAKSLEMLAITFAPSIIHDRLQTMANAIMAGDSFSQACDSLDDLLPEEQRLLLTIGENTGQLEKILHLVAVQLFNQVFERIERLTTWIEPLIIIWIGGCLCFFIFILYEPVFQLGLSF